VDFQGRLFACEETSSHLANEPKPDGHFTVSNAVIVAALPPSVVSVAFTSQFMPLPALVSNSSPPVKLISTRLLTFVPPWFPNRGQGERRHRQQHDRSDRADYQQPLVPVHLPFPSS
jgi:hypothetical protein